MGSILSRSSTFLVIEKFLSTVATRVNKINVFFLYLNLQIKLVIAYLENPSAKF